MSCLRNRESEFGRFVVDYAVDFAGDQFFVVVGDLNLHLDCAKASSESAKIK
jgi:hypothetical protein